MTQKCYVITNHVRTETVTRVTLHKYPVPWDQVGAPCKLDIDCLIAVLNEHVYVFSTVISNSGLEEYGGPLCCFIMAQFMNGAQSPECAGHCCIDSGCPSKNNQDGSKYTLHRRTWNPQNKTDPVDPLSAKVAKVYMPRSFGTSFLPSRCDHIGCRWNTALLKAKGYSSDALHIGRQRIVVPS